MPCAQIEPSDRQKRKCDKDQDNYPLPFLVYAVLSLLLPNHSRCRMLLHAT